MAGESRILEPLAVAAAGGQSIRVAAEAIGCSVDYAYKLAAEPGFKLRVAELRMAATDRAVGVLADNAGEAVEVLVGLMDEGNDPTVRLRAATAILDRLVGLTQKLELRQRVDALEGYLRTTTNEILDVAEKIGLKTGD